MTPPTPQDEAKRAARALFASLLLAAAGMSGAMAGAQDVMGRSVDHTPGLESGQPSEIREIISEVEAYPHRTALGAINVVVSAMLVVAGLLIARRRPSGVWLATQAVVANVFFVLVRSGVRVSHVWALGDAMAVLARHALSQQELPENVGAMPDLTTMARGSWLVFELISSGLVIFLHVFIGWRARRPEVREFVGASDDAAGER